MDKTRYPILDPFHRRLYKVLTEDFDGHMSTLLGGGAFPGAGEQKTTGEKYAFQIGYLHCLENVLARARDIETVMQGGEPTGETNG